MSDKDDKGKHNDDQGIEEKVKISTPKSSNQRSRRKDFYSDLIDQPEQADIFDDHDHIRGGDDGMAGTYSCGQAALDQERTELENYDLPPVEMSPDKSYADNFKDISEANHPVDKETRPSITSTNIEMTPILLNSDDIKSDNIKSDDIKSDHSIKDSASNSVVYELSEPNIVDASSIVLFGNREDSSQGPLNEDLKSKEIILETVSELEGPSQFSIRAYQGADFDFERNTDPLISVGTDSNPIAQQARANENTSNTSLESKLELTKKGSRNLYFSKLKSHRVKSFLGAIVLSSAFILTYKQLNQDPTSILATQPSTLNSTSISTNSTNSTYDCVLSATNHQSSIGMELCLINYVQEHSSEYLTESQELVFNYNACEDKIISLNKDLRGATLVYNILLHGQHLQDENESKAINLIYDIGIVPCDGKIPFPKK